MPVCVNYMLKCPYLTAAKVGSLNENDSAGVMEYETFRYVQIKTVIMVVKGQGETQGRSLHLGCRSEDKGFPVSPKTSPET